MGVWSSFKESLDPRNIVETTEKVLTKPITETIKPAVDSLAEFTADTVFKPLTGDFSAYTFSNFREHFFDMATAGYWDEIKQEFYDAYTPALGELAEDMTAVEGYSIDDYRTLMEKGGSLASYRGENVIQDDWNIEKQKVKLKDLASANLDLENRITEEQITASLAAFSERLESVRSRQLSQGYGALL